MDDGHKRIWKSPGYIMVHLPMKPRFDWLHSGFFLNVVLTDYWIYKTEYPLFCLYWRSGWSLYVRPFLLLSCFVLMLLNLQIVWMQARHLFGVPPRLVPKKKASSHATKDQLERHTQIAIAIVTKELNICDGLFFDWDRIMTVIPPLRFERPLFSCPCCRKPVALRPTKAPLLDQLVSIGRGCIEKGARSPDAGNASTMPINLWAELFPCILDGL